MVCFWLAAMVAMLTTSARASSAVRGAAACGCTMQDRVGCTLAAFCDEPPSFGIGFGSSHNFRVHPYMVVNPKQKPPAYHLMVNITWRPPHEAQCSNITGFEVALRHADSWHCYTISLEHTVELMTNIGRQSIVWFWSSDLFEFGFTYEVQIITLPRRHECAASAIEAMPVHPAADEDARELYNRHGCNGIYNSNAYKWVSTFQLIHVKPWQKMIDVEFIAAPVAYCLHAYELRLMRTSREIVQSMVIYQSQLHWTTYDNDSIGIGKGSFVEVEPNNYFIGVIPIDRDEENVCKCPAPGGLCSCSLAIQPNIVMPEIELPIHSDPCIDATSADDVFLCQAANQTDTKMSVTMAVGNSSNYIFVIIVLVAMCAAITAAFCLICKRWRLKMKGSVRLYLLSQKADEFGDSNNADKGELLPVVSHLNILVIYSRDSTAHVGVVKRFAQWIESVHPMNRVCVDYLCSGEIMENKYDWMVASIKRANRIIFINSYGSFMRYRSKVMSDCKVGLIQRKDADQFDDLFLGQVDLLLAELFANNLTSKTTDRRLISIRFAYTPLAYVLPPLAIFPCYELPSHINYFMETVVKSPPVGATHQLIDLLTDQLKAAIETAALEIQTAVAADDSDDWFKKSHCRKLCAGDFDEPASYQATTVIPKNPQQHSCSRRRADSEPIVNVDDSGFGSAKSHSETSHSYG